MKKPDKNVEAFFALLRAGLWEKDVQLLPYGKIDFAAIYKLAEEQSVVGLVAAGLENVVDIRVPKEEALAFVRSALLLEQHNVAMNTYIRILVGKLRVADIYTILVKGQGVAQCYERPLWRTPGDIDLFLSSSNYIKAKDYLVPLADHVDNENQDEKHLGMIINDWAVELHGTQSTNISNRIDGILNEIQKEVFYGGNVRSWMNGNTQVFLPKADEDVIFVFTHILKHFYDGGIGLRQVCDWCRLLWTYRESINKKLLENRIRSMGVMDEWNAFAALAVNKLGMPAEAMPLYSISTRWKRKANMVLSLIFESGNFGQNRDYSYKKRYPVVMRYMISLYIHSKDAVQRFIVFPKNSILSWFRTIIKGVAFAIKGNL